MFLAFVFYSFVPHTIRFTSSNVALKYALLLVERTYLLHLVVAEGKIKYLDILLNIIRIGGTGNDGKAFLNVPT